MVFLKSSRKVSSVEFDGGGAGWVIRLLHEPPGASPRLSFSVLQGKPDANAFRLICFDSIRPSKIGIGVVCSAFSEQQVQSDRASQPLRHAQVCSSCVSCQSYFIGKL
jgi:hypothetical protein